MLELTDLIFLTSLCFVAIGHELDAIQQEEWRFFFAKVPISETAAYQLFNAIHVPAYIWMIVVWQSPAFQLGFSLFAIAHAGVHFALRNHPLINFDGWFSRLWIDGGGLLAIFYLLLRVA